MRHRLHHRFTDTEDDPHSIADGLLHAHMGWLFTPPPAFRKQRLISRDDLLADPVVCWQRRLLLPGYIVFGLLYPALLGLALGGSAMDGLLWPGVMARFLSWHCIWSINSLSHWKGEKDYSLRSSAVWMKAAQWLQNGEGAGHSTSGCSPLTPPSH